MGRKYPSETPRSAMRGQCEGSSVLVQRTHKSTSLESSANWFKEEVRYQMERGGLFEDPFFPAVDSSIKSGSRSGSQSYRWLRPSELTRCPRFIADGVSRFDIKQGELGNCWVIAALASLSMYPDLFKQVVPPDQSFEKSSKYPYVGMFWFRLWQFGNWYDVVVDDRLPTRNGHLVFMHSADSNEFWSALLEKAYAKLVSSYDALRGGCTAEAMEDFTGGLTELVDLGTKTPANLYGMMEHALNRASLMACSIDADPHEIEANGPLGLILGHAYSVTDIREVHTNYESRSVRLIRLRNPWGNDCEWSGPWSDQSKEWRSIPPDERKRIGLTFDEDGEFWMSFDDFVRYFSRLELCHLGPESVAVSPSATGSRYATRRWKITCEEGEWLRNSTAGGCTNFPNTFYMNPQFHVQIVDPDESDDDGTGTLVVGLMQKGLREKHIEPHVIGYSVFRMPSSAQNDQLLDRRFFMTNSSVARSPVFINMREVCGRHKLRPGHYVIVPCTFNPNEEAKFILRIFSERACDSNELDDVTQISITNLPDQPIKAADDKLIEKLEIVFNRIAGASGAITYTQLQDILNEAFTKDFPFDGFSRETARSMMALMDADLSGGLGFGEFKKLWMELRVWKTIFKKFDEGHTGSLEAFELRNVMRTIGFHVSNMIYKAIACRYANEKGRISFDDYILLLVRLSTVFETFKAQERTRDGRAVFQAEDFIRSVIYI
ncbi:Calpain-B isoform 2 [Schistosoma japonicum]|uniref:Calpain-B isoform 2 n=2 Tax=Schistosoma japonicum TaxID=6182 RepID=A0A4Z2DHR9_SCHJA|nr:Calpain-B [Schistosoma japonicum]TNN15750.1 Calpain-B isoform 2 [Schistosoma japonicum]